MKAGDLKQRVTIQRRSATALDTWTDVATVWASVEPLTGNRILQGVLAITEASGMVRIRYRADIVPSMRLVFEGRVLNIVGIINPKEAKRETQIMYREQAIP